MHSCPHNQHGLIDCEWMGDTKWGVEHIESILMYRFSKTRNSFAASKRRPIGRRQLSDPRLPSMPRWSCDCRGFERLPNEKESEAVKGKPESKFPPVKNRNQFGNFRSDSVAGYGVFRGKKAWNWPYSKDAPKNIDFIECFSLPCAQTQKYFCPKSTQTQKYFWLFSAQTQKYSGGFEAHRGLLFLFSCFLSTPKCDGGFYRVLQDSSLESGARQFFSPFYLCPTR